MLHKIKKIVEKLNVEIVDEKIDDEKFIVIEFNDENIDDDVDIIILNILIWNEIKYEFVDDDENIIKIHQ